MIRKRTDKEVVVKKREGFTAFVLTDRVEVPELSAVDVAVHGAHDEERIERGTRAYMVMEGTGQFTVDGTTVEVGPGTYVVIRAGHTYSYEGQMRLFEVNTPAVVVVTKFPK